MPARSDEALLQSISHLYTGLLAYEMGAALAHVLERVVSVVYGPHDPE